MKISFLLHNAYGSGGTISTTFNLARALAERHEVEIVSVLRHQERPNFLPGPGVLLRPLVDLRNEQDHPLHRRPARTYPAAEYRYKQYSELTDQRIGEWLAGASDDPAVGYTSEDLVEHLRSEHSTYRAVLDSLIESAGFRIVDVQFRRSVYASYTCAVGG